MSEYFYNLQVRCSIALKKYDISWNNSQRLIIGLLFPYLTAFVQSQGADLAKNHHEAQPPHELSTPFHCSHQMILPSLSTGKNPLKSPQKESNYHFTTTFSGRLVKTPSVSRFHYAGTASQNTPKTWKMAEPIGGFWSSPFLGVQNNKGTVKEYIFLQWGLSAQWGLGQGKKKE